MIIVAIMIMETAMAPPPIPAWTAAQRFTMALKHCGQIICGWSA